MSIAEQHNVPAAWYPDLNVPNQLRWWDGRAWGFDVRPIEAEVEVAPPAEIVEPTPQPQPILHALARPTESYGHATPEQLRAWPPPQSEQRNEPGVASIEQDWSTAELADDIQRWTPRADEPVPSVAEPAYAAAVFDIPIAAARIASPTMPDSFSHPVDPAQATHAHDDLNNWQPATAAGAVPLRPATENSAATPPFAAQLFATEAPSAGAGWADSRTPEQATFRGLSAVPPFERIVEPPAESTPAQRTEWPLEPAGTPARPASPRPAEAAPAPAQPYLPPPAQPRAPAVPAALTRRQLRELVGPLTIGTEAM